LSSTNIGNGSTQAAPTRAAVLRPRIPGNRFDQRDEQASLEEAVGLAAAISLEVVLSEIVPVNRVRPNTFVGSGAVERLKGAFEDLGITVAIFDCKLSPVQQRNLERGLNVKVIDRTGLILEIFGARARTHEGRLQVELASLSYQRSRLVRSWTHLERQRGGFGFLGGPGESQLEIDRRLIGDRVGRLKRELEEVRRARDLQRKGRKRADLPVVALVGYTNAGKSTLFNRLTASEVFAKDLLFATLDPTMRAVRLPSGRNIVLSDTVGFIADLPTDLVAAFRATLEEVIEADVIVHVRDVAHPDSEAQRQDVEAVLSDIGLHDRIVAGELIEALNKIDLIDDVARQRLLGGSPSAADARVPISALTGEGMGDLLEAIDTALGADEQPVELDVPQTDGALLAWLYRHGRVLERQDGEGTTHLRVLLDSAARARLEARRQSPAMD
jgi:GTP-binding protein HflX